VPKKTQLVPKRTSNANVELSWYGVFKFVQMSPEVIEEFTIDQNASSVVRQERKVFWLNSM
jgi:hypothetical protein